MNKKLIQIAILTSPILAIYGIIPFYIFGKMDIFQTIKLIVIVLFSILITWGILIWLISRYPKISNFRLFVFSYGINILFRFLSMQIAIFFDKVPPFQEDWIFAIITSIAIHISLIVIIRAITSNYQKAEAEKKVQELLLENTEAQKQILMHQIQPHFLFNTLSVLKSLIIENKTSAEEYVVKLSNFLRYSIHSNTQDLTPLYQEINFVQDFIDLQQMRFENKFSYKIEIQEDKKNLLIPALSLITPLENIFKHNYFTEKNPLQFTIKYEDGYVHIENSKSIIKQNEKSGTGLSNLNKRCELILQKGIIIVDSISHFIVKIPTNTI